MPRRFRSPPSLKSPPTRRFPAVQIQVNTDNHTDADVNLIDEVRGMLEEKLRRFESRVTRLEVHLSDQNSAAKGGDDDMQCKIEARLNGMQPITVRERAATIPQAVRGSIAKLRSALDTSLGKLNER